MYGRCSRSIAQVNQIYWIACVAAGVFWEGRGLDKQFGKKDNYLPGMLDIDPLGMDSPAFREAEILNGPRRRRSSGISPST